MSLFWAVVGYVIYLYLLVVLARFVVEAMHQFARRWRAAGVTAVGIELVFMATDPPVKLLRRLIPPLRLGAVALDLSILVLLIAILVLYWGATSLA